MPAGSSGPPPSPSAGPSPADYRRDFYRRAYRSVQQEQSDLYRPRGHDSAMGTVEETREKYATDRKSLESSARGKGLDGEPLRKLLDAFDKLAKSAERAAERNEYMGRREAEAETRKVERERASSERATDRAARSVERAIAKEITDQERAEARAKKEEEREAKQSAAEERRQHKEEELKRKQHDAEVRAGWQRMTGKNSAGDALYGADRLEKDPRGYLMNVASMVMSGPVMSRMAGLFSGTMSGAARGYQAAGAAGAAVGAAAGATGDVMNLGRNASPQAGSTLDQSWELFKTKAGSAIAADKFLNMVSNRIQSAGDSVASTRDGTRAYMSRIYSHMGDVPTWMGGTVATGYGAIRGLGGYLMGEKAPEDKKPRLMAPPTIAGVGGALGGTSSYEQYALSSGMSSLSASPIEQEQMLEQLKNMVGRLDKVIDNTEMLKTYTPAWR